MSHRALHPDDADWITRPHEPGVPARHVAELSEPAGLRHVRANVWRYEPGASGRRHRHPVQDETFVVLEGTLTMYLGEPPERIEQRSGGIVHVAAGTALQSANEGEIDLVVYVHGWPPEVLNAEILDSAI
jgi:quercetin dioxygenase-like cupin family protein